jgi:hypothetical protein
MKINNNYNFFNKTSRLNLVSKYQNDEGTREYVGTRKAYHVL